MIKFMAALAVVGLLAAAPMAAQAQKAKAGATYKAPRGPDGKVLPSDL